RLGRSYRACPAWHRDRLRRHGERTLNDAHTSLPTEQPWTREEFEAQLRAKGSGYHIHHPFHGRMNQEQLRPDQIRTWVANRFYYQIRIPQKDAPVMANCPDREIRRRWIHRMLDHDGYGEN